MRRLAFAALTLALVLAAAGQAAAAEVAGVAFDDRVTVGERIVFAYVPGTGTTVQVAGETKGTLAGKDFADAPWAAWIGAKPATKDLRAGLLGG